MSEKIPEVFEIFERKVAYILSFGLTERKAGVDDAIADLLNYFSSVVARGVNAEAELASTKARLAEFEVGYDPAVKLPADTEKVLFVDEDGVFYAGGFDSKGKYWWQIVMIVAPTHIIGQVGKIPQESVARWFPLPGSKGE